jgi:SAM-dependent methyltransferase
MLMFVLGSLLGFTDLPVYLWPHNKNLKILEPCARGPQALFLKEKFDFYAPEFDLEKIKAGADPRKYADLQALAFADQTFDIVIASEVFEHVREDVKGFREVYRTLKKGGTFLLTVPYDHQREQTNVFVQVDGDQDIYLVPPRYHGGGGSTLAYREYGRDLLALLNSVGFAVGYIEPALPRFQIYKSKMMVCQKSAYLDLGNAYSGENANGRAFRPLGALWLFRWFVLLKYNLKSFVHFFHEAKRKIRARFFMSGNFGEAAHLMQQIHSANRAGAGDD